MSTDAGVFEVSLPGGEMGVDELGVWDVPAAAAFDLPDAAFDLPDAEAFDVPRPRAGRWHVGLPADPALAGQALAARRGRLERAEQALPQANRRLARLFGGEPLAPAGPELEMAGWIAGAAPEAGLDARAEDWREALPAALALFDRVRQSMLHLSLVETRAEAASPSGGAASPSGGAASPSGGAASPSGERRRLGLTVVSWTGDYHTVWGSGLSPEAARHHMQTVELAVRTRDAWLRMALIVAAGGLQLAALFPANPVLGLLATYRFVKRVLDQAQALHTLESQ